MRAAFTIAMFSLCCLTASDEGLGLRRIADFWEEGEYQIAKTQMEEFLVEFPESQYANVLCMAMGDLSLREKNYKQALDYYAKVKDQDLVFLNRLQCLYHLQWHATLADVCESYLCREETEAARKLQATYFLAIALYQQCLNAPKETMATLADRARPYFESLTTSELSDEVAGAFAHLRCILGDYEGASNLYVKLASSSGNSDELLFQAALLQSKFDKDLALKTFSQLKSGPFAAEATYNRLVLSFEQGQYEGIVSSKEAWLASVPKDKLGLGHLFVGQSFLKLKDYTNAVNQFSSFLSLSAPCQATRSGLVQLIEASYLTADLSLLSQSIEKLQSYDSQDPALEQALFSKCLLLKKVGNYSEAIEGLSALIASDSEAVHFELAQLYNLTQNWGEAKKHAMAVTSPERLPFAWNYAAQSCVELKQDTDLQQLLNQAPFLSEADKSSWEYRLAKLELDLGHFTTARARLEAIAETLQPDGQLLLSLCYQQSGDEAAFCSLAEAALAAGATAITPADQHLSLFNSYIARDELAAAASHLFSAFLANAEIHRSNLLWLSNYAHDQGQFEIAYPVLLKAQPDDADLLLKLAQLHFKFNQDDAAVAILKTLTSKEAKLSLAEGLLRMGSDLPRAERLLDEVACLDTLRDASSARAALLSAQIKKSQGQFDRVAVLLKDLTLQKTILNEPTHLEAALEYVDLQSQPEKQLSILNKLKASFESNEDLLSKDYHAARQLNVEKNGIYTSYMQYFDAQKLLLDSQLLTEDDQEQQKELQTKAKAILLQISAGEGSPLRFRVERRLAELGNAVE